jgi:hypothetical protein
MKPDVDPGVENQLVKRTQLEINDKIRIRTKNSEYNIEVIDQSIFTIKGGWFDKKGLSPFLGSIEGATWGWGDLLPDIIAKIGMRIKFANGPTTSHVKSIIYLK